VILGRLSKGDSFGEHSSLSDHANIFGV
jgi:hypothetical protein